MKERINEIYNSSIKNKRKEKWFENYNKNDKKILHFLTSKGFLKESEMLLKNLRLKVFFKNFHKLENLYINENSEKIENLSNVVYLIKCK